MWVQPGDFTPAKGMRLLIRLLVGHDQEIDEVERKPERIVSFALHGAGKSETIQGRAKDKPAGKIQMGGDGIYTIVYQSTHAYIELEADAFTRYLGDEGLEHVIEERARLGESDRKGQESYARYCKALVRVGNAQKGFDRKIGLPIELVALTNPFTAGKGKKLRFALEFEGEPLANALVELVSLDDLTRKFQARTGKDGRVSFTMPGPGKWMVATTHMRRAPKALKGDWQSFWASLAFQVGAD